MSLAGSGAVAIWHDIAAEGRDAFYQWHGREHMPERVAIPGFLRGRRYVAIDRTDGVAEFFNLYETASTAVLTGDGYLDRLNHPTPWTVETVRHFRNVARSLCEVAASAGEGQGGLIATFRYALRDGCADTHRHRVVSQVVPQTAQLAGIAGCHLLVADEAASAIETAERKAREGRNAIPPWVVLVEGWGDGSRFGEWCERFAAGPAFAEAAAPPEVALYRLQNLREARDPG
jgi:hypothetical protein